MVLATRAKTINSPFLIKSGYNENTLCQTALCNITHSSNHRKTKRTLGSIPHSSCMGPSIYYVSKEWVGGVKKWQFLLMVGVGGSEKVKKRADVI